MNDIGIRDADIHDVDWLFEECEAFAKFYQTKISLAGNAEYGKKFLTGIVQNHYVKIGCIKNQRVGFIAGLVSPHHFNPDIIMLTELLWWVQAEHRKSGVGHELFKKFVEFGKLNCNWITFTMEVDSPVPDEYLIKAGFKKKEIAFTMECN